MKCGDKEWKHCQMEKLGCDGCYYNKKNNEDNKSQINTNNINEEENINHIPRLD